MEIYVFLWITLLFYLKLAGYLNNKGLKINDYDTSVAKKYIVPIS